MNWWKRLKTWQKGAIILGAIHAFTYFLMFLIFGSFASYFIIFIEYPWLSILMLLGKALESQYHLLKFPGDLSSFPFGLLIGTVFYAFIGALSGWGVASVRRKNHLGTLQ
ncbi:MAG TPA: hypothetical protein VFH55_00855 [Nitrospiria bacterium]|nr:hypothetical protein [Nitrospiria bacterium]